MPAPPPAPKHKRAPRPESVSRADVAAEPPPPPGTRARLREIERELRDIEAGNIEGFRLRLRLRTAVLPLVERLIDEVGA